MAKVKSIGNPVKGESYVERFWDKAKNDAARAEHNQREADRKLAWDSLSRKATRKQAAEFEREAKTLSEAEQANQQRAANLASLWGHGKLSLSDRWATWAASQFFLLHMRDTERYCESRCKAISSRSLNDPGDAWVMAWQAWQLEATTRGTPFTLENCLHCCSNAIKRLWEGRTASSNKRPSGASVPTHQQIADDMSELRHDYTHGHGRSEALAGYFTTEKRTKIATVLSQGGSPSDAARVIHASAQATHDNVKKMGRWLGKTPCKTASEKQDARREAAAVCDDLVTWIDLIGRTASLLKTRHGSVALAKQFQS